MSTKKIRIDFYQVNLPDTANETFEGILTRIGGFPDNDSRTAKLSEHYFRLQELDQDKQKVTGELIRIRMDQMPLRAKLNGKTKPIVFDADEGLGEETAFAVLFSNTIGLAGIAVGFLATAQSIMISVGDRRLLRQFRQIGYEKHLHKYFIEAIHSSFCLGIVSVLCLLVDPKSDPATFRRISTTWVFVVCVAVLSYYRIVSLFMKVLSSPPAKPGGTP